MTEQNPYVNRIEAAALALDGVDTCEVSVDDSGDRLTFRVFYSGLAKQGYVYVPLNTDPTLRPRGSVLLVGKRKA